MVIIAFTIILFINISVCFLYLLLVSLFITDVCVFWYMSACVSIFTACLSLFTTCVYIVITFPYLHCLCVCFNLLYVITYSVNVHRLCGSPLVSIFTACVYSHVCVLLFRCLSVSLVSPFTAYVVF